MKATDDTLHRNFSKIDPSGTDPNRYASIPSPKKGQNGHTAQSWLLGLPVNVGKIERIAMVAAGTYLLYKSLSGPKKNVGQSIAGGTMLMRGISGYCPVYQAMDSNPKLSGSNVNIRTSLEVNQSAHTVYNAWRKLENLPKFMSHLASVNEKDKLRSDWTAKGPGGIGSVSWTAEVLMDEPGQVLSWHSLPGATIDNAGKVVFTEVGPGRTRLDVTISYHAPLGVAGETAAKLLNPLFEKMVKSDIENFKSYIETGSVNSK